MGVKEAKSAKGGKEGTPGKKAHGPTKVRGGQRPHPDTPKLPDDDDPRGLPSWLTGQGKRVG